jgi:radical SAM superfamily enzyme YgiQ (UPF0313 family)
MLLQFKSRKKIVLATPPVYQSPLPLEVHRPMIPQGPAMIAAMLRARGHEVTCFDAYERSCRYGYFDSSEFARFLLDEKPDFIGFSVYSDGYPSALSMIEIVRIVLPECIVVVGGPHFTIFPDSVPASVDYVVVGEGEIAMIALVEGLLPKAAAANEKDVAFRVRERDECEKFDGLCNLIFDVVQYPVAKSNEDLQLMRVSIRKGTNGRSQVVSVRDRLTNLTLGYLPFPAYDLFLNEEGAAYQFDEPSLGLDGFMLNLNTSRGCSYGCSFCSVEGVWGKAYRWFPTPWILGLAKLLKETCNLRSIFFREDEFIMKARALSGWIDGAEERDEILALAKGLHALDIRWAIENRADAFGAPARAEQYFKRLAEFGLAGVFVGVESASDKVRNTILNKNLSLETLRSFFRWAREAGVCTVANVMYGVRRMVQGKLETDDRGTDWIATDTLLAEMKPTRIDRYVYVGVPVSPMYLDHLNRDDYDYIDVNGYLYPKGFTECAQAIYGEGVEMAMMPGMPNLRVGPGLLPGIPTTSYNDLGSDKLIAAVDQLDALPDVVELTLTALRADKNALPRNFGVLDQLARNLDRKPLPAAVLHGVLEKYRPGSRATIIRPRTGPTLAVVTVRSPSAEVLLLVAQIKNAGGSSDLICSLLEKVAASLNSYVRGVFVKRFGPHTNVNAIASAPARHLKVV